DKTAVVVIDHHDHRLVHLVAHDPAHAGLSPVAFHHLLLVLLLAPRPRHPPFGLLGALGSGRARGLHFRFFLLLRSRLGGRLGCCLGCCFCCRLGRRLAWRFLGHFLGRLRFGLGCFA